MNALPEQPQGAGWMAPAVVQLPAWGQAEATAGLGSICRASFCPCVASKAARTLLLAQSQLALQAGVLRHKGALALLGMQTAG